MKTGQIPVLLDIVERGRKAPEENRLQPQSPPDHAEDDTVNEDPTIPNAVSRTAAAHNDRATTDEQPVLPETMIEQILDEPDERQQLVEQAMAIIMPKLEIYARKAVEQLVDINDRSGKT